MITANLLPQSQTASIQAVALGKIWEVEAAAPFHQNRMANQGLPTWNLPLPFLTFWNAQSAYLELPQEDRTFELLKWGAVYLDTWR